MKLYKPLKQHSGRNNRGVITMRHRGGMHKRKYRLVDFNYNSFYNQKGVIKTIEYDPNRRCNISKVNYSGLEKYILTPENLKIGESIISSKTADNKVGNSTELKNLSIGTLVYNVEMEPGKGARISRSGGSFCEIVSKQDKFVFLKFPSGETRQLNGNCWCTIGIPKSPITPAMDKKTKAGQNRWLGKRPHVRGSAMNAVDHPHGGGEGKSPIGRKHPVTPWGKHTQGKKTRSKKKPKLII